MRTSTGGGQTTRAPSRSCPILPRTTTPSSPQVATASSSPQHGPDRRQSCGLLTRMELAHSGWSRGLDSVELPAVVARRPADCLRVTRRGRTVPAWTIGARGGIPVTPHHRAREPAASQAGPRNGKTIYFGPTRAANRPSGRTPMTGGAPERITRSGDAMRGFESADGEALVNQARLPTRDGAWDTTGDGPLRKVPLGGGERVDWLTAQARAVLPRSYSALLPGMRRVRPPRPARWR